MLTLVTPAERGGIGAVARGCCIRTKYQGGFQPNEKRLTPKFYWIFKNHVVKIYLILFVPTTTFQTPSPPTTLHYRRTPHYHHTQPTAVDPRPVIRLHLLLPILLVFSMHILQHYECFSRNSAFNWRWIVTRQPVWMNNKQRAMICFSQYNAVLDIFSTIAFCSFR